MESDAILIGLYTLIVGFEACQNMMTVEVVVEEVGHASIAEYLEGGGTRSLNSINVIITFTPQQPFSHLAGTQQSILETSGRINGIRSNSRLPLLQRRIRFVASSRFFILTSQCQTF